MKQLLLLFLFALPVYGQYSIHPVVSPITIDSIIVVSGKDTVWGHDGDFTASITSGLQFGSTKFPLGTTVLTRVTDSLLIMSAKATGTDSLHSISFGYFQSHAYAAGDTMGLPFNIGQWSQIDKIVVIDDAKQITSVDIIFFDLPFVPTLDSAAFGISDGDAEAAAAYFTVGGTGYNKALGNNTVMVTPWTNQPIYFTPSKTLWGQLITVGTPTFTAVNNLTVRVYGR